MKNILMFLSIAATVALLALPVAAKNLVVAPASETQDACTQEQRDALYKTFVDNRQADQKKAYDAAKKYLACPVTTPNESQTKIIEYLTKWVGLFEKGDRKNRFTDELYNKKNYVEAFKLGGEILKDDAENTKVMVDLGANGYLVGPLNNPQLATEAVDYARKALAALDASSEQRRRHGVPELHDRHFDCRKRSVRRSQAPDQISAVRDAAQEVGHHIRLDRGRV